MTTDNTPATLATAKHGGCVQLATVPYDRAREQIGDAYNAGTHGIGYSQQIMELHDAVFAGQPSPGGQGDARSQFEEYRGGDCERDAQGYYTNARTAQDWAIWQAALAARQPVGEQPAIWVSPRQLAVHKDRVPGDGGAYLPARLTKDGQFTKPLYATPPAQAVDLGARPIETAPRDGTMVRLLVLFEEHATEDTAESAWTIGVCNDDHVGEDQRIGWQFAGWCWTHDHFTEGKGTPVGWLPLIDSQAVRND